MGYQNPGWFGDWAGNFYVVASLDMDFSEDFADWYAFASDHYLGASLIAPFISSFEARYLELYDLHRQTGLYAQRTALYVTQIDDGWMLDDLNWYYFPNIYAIEHTPTKLISDLLLDIWPDWYWFTQDPGYMVQFWLEDALPWLAGWFTDPASQVMAWIDGAWPGFQTLRQDPAAAVKAWVSASDPFFEGLDVDPKLWLDAKIDARIPEVPEPPPTPAVVGLDMILALFDAPAQWLLERIYGMAEHWLRWMVEGVL